MNRLPKASSDSISTDLTPLFVFSIPRTGSTIAQRILATHEDIATAGEPHILLHFLYSLKQGGCYTEYGHQRLASSIAGFCHELPNGIDGYLEEVRAFALRLYAKAAPTGAKYFLDKTPRYHLIVEEIIRLFPNGKFLFLWRSPLASVSSMLETWQSGNWFISRNEIDLFEGIANLTKAYEVHGTQAHAVRYEDLLARPEETLRGVFAYLELAFDPTLLSDFAKVKFSRGDWNMHRNQYQVLNREPLEKWKRILSNPIRKAWCRRYLRWIGRHRLAMMGYDLDDLLDELNALPLNLRFVVSDLLRMSYNMAYRVLEFRMMKHKLSDLLTQQRTYVHT